MRFTIHLSLLNEYSSCSNENGCLRYFSRRYMSKLFEGFLHSIALTHLILKNLFQVIWIVTRMAKYWERRTCCLKIEEQFKIVWNNNPKDMRVNRKTICLTVFVFSILDTYILALLCQCCCVKSLVSSVSVLNHNDTYVKDE